MTLPLSATISPPVTGTSAVVSGSVMGTVSVTEMVAVGVAVSVIGVISVNVTVGTVVAWGVGVIVTGVVRDDAVVTVIRGVFVGKDVSVASAVGLFVGRTSVVMVGMGVVVGVIVAVGSTVVIISTTVVMFTVGVTVVTDVSVAEDVVVNELLSAVVNGKDKVSGAVTGKVVAVSVMTVESLRVEVAGDGSCVKALSSDAAILRCGEKGTS